MSLLTLITQIGGVVWIVVFGSFKLNKSLVSPLKRSLVFLVVYLFSTLVITPQLAKLNGRTVLPVLKSGNLIAHNWITPILNRHYVKPRLKADLIKLANKINSKNDDLKISYLDANFPFMDGFPLLPHLSHSDGKKVDLSFYYKLGQEVGNLKPSNTGYGKFVDPIASEQNTTTICKSRGYWHYDYTKYVTLGSRDDLSFDLENTKNLTRLLVNEPNAHKLLIEPHLKTRMNLTHDKIRFQGCPAVRHDDHIHYQIK